MYIIMYIIIIIIMLDTLYHNILVNLVSKIHITKIGIAKINVCIH